ncbi:hypothetical protein Tco_0988436 [Tanacetum coccineum]|uniref:Retrovirus-related Pol polyprotein from transposon TNT 1-94 n=1 Tax=Tanacetum coccineum TaxID=301880 RepID=A0ABQ5ESA3_9ASTR
MKDKLEYKGNNVVGALMNVPIFDGTFFVVTDFTVLEDMDVYRDEGMGDVIVGESFLKEIKIKARRFDGMITIYNGPREGKSTNVGEVSTIWKFQSVRVLKPQDDIATYLVKVCKLWDDWEVDRYENANLDSKRHAFWSLNEDILKITVLKTNTPYPSRKIRRIRACIHQRPQKIKDQYAVSIGLNTPYSRYGINIIFWMISNVVPTPRNPQYAVSNTLICRSKLGSELTFLAGSELKTSELDTSELKTSELKTSEYRGEVEERDTLAEGTKGAQQLGLKRARVYSDLSPEDKDRQEEKQFTTTIVRYAQIINECGNSHDMSRMQMNSKFVNNMLPEWGRFITAMKLNSVQDGRVVVQNVQGRQNRGQGNNARGAGHIARNCTQPKRPQNSEYFKDKMLMMQAQENEVALDEKQLLFIAGGQDNVVDEDVDEQPIQDLTLNVDNVFQAKDCDAFDSDVDEAPTTQTMFMANLSFADLFMMKSVQYEIHDDVPPNYVVDPHANYTSDSNMIPYDQYVKDNTVPVVQSNVSSVPNDAYMMILNGMHEQPA